MKLSKEFIEYVMDFYGKGGIYDRGFKRREIVEAFKIYLELYGESSYAGDSLDREKIRDIVLEERRKVAA